MPFTGLTGPNQLSVLAHVVDDYCRSNKIAASSEEREEAARLLLSLYEQGWRTVEELKAALARRHKTHDEPLTS